MSTRDSTLTWQEYLKPYSGIGSSALFDPVFFDRWGGQAWKPTEDDRVAAGKLHVQIVSRITTQTLGYLDGVEKTALDSIYAVFGQTRDISTAYVKANHFNTLVWHVLNTHVRPFTAKWHRESTLGGLAALDSTDDFRAELSALQITLRRFEELLRDIRDAEPEASEAQWREDDTSARDAIGEEMREPLPWGIPATQLDSETAGAINRAEKEAIAQRRDYYELGAKPHAVGLALSGGGIRSATFSLGVLVALARRGLLPQFDYLSTVSGGGYVGSFLTAFLNSGAQSKETPSPLPESPSKPNEPSPEKTPPDIGLRSVQAPFSREKGEGEALRHIRHHSRYLAMGSVWAQTQMLFAQLYGLAINVASIGLLVALAVLLERLLRSESGIVHALKISTTAAAIALAIAAAVAPALLRTHGKGQQYADRILAAIGVVLLLLLCWKGLGLAHEWIHHHRAFQTWTGPRIINEKLIIAIVSAIPVLASTAVRLFGTKFKRAGVVMVFLFAISAPVSLAVAYLLMYEWAQRGELAAPFGSGPLEQPFGLAILGVSTVIYIFVLNINFTSPHRHYRNKLAEAYLIQRRQMENGNVPKSSAPKSPFDEAVTVRLGEIGAASHRGPYHLINAALNVPASNDPRMQGRLADFFLFSPAFCGSPLTGYRRTNEWEHADPHLDLGTAMAISGAAAAPQMGAATLPQFRFWLALLNVRLGYWLRNPAKRAWLGPTPGLWFLLKEMLGSMDEKSPWLNVSDGGHIENLGVYELLRRRCKYIVAVDGEQDSRMTFAALTTLQRLAAIDLGVQIDVNLDDLRLNDKGYSRSHFRFCRIKYPSKDSDEPVGYLLYLKLSLTGNEGEFLRRYRLDEPAFPHHSTADQFFSEAQFEAYRSLGEHVGDKLFLKALVGKLANSDSVQVEEWFCELGKNLLQPLPIPTSAKSKK
jgi:hypothetical protein